LREHSGIGTVFFNGAEAQRLFERHVMPTLPSDIALEYVRLPSTSPANATLDLEAKIDAWRSVARATGSP